MIVIFYFLGFIVFALLLTSLIYAITYPGAY